MRVVFDAYWWAEGPAAVRHVLREIVMTWRRQYPADDLALLIRRRHISQVMDELDGSFTLIPTAIRPQALLASIGLAWAAKRHQADVTISHNFSTPGRTPSVTFLHDVMFLEHPEWFTCLERGYFSLMPRTLCWSHLVVTSSETEATRIRKLTSAKRVVPIGIGISEELVEAAPIPVDGLSSASFLLCVGRLNVRKNLRTVLEAAERASGISRANPLVVVGSPDGKAGPSLPRGVQAAIADGAIRLLGHVSEGQLAWLYGNALAYVNCSLDEGFGMPLLEAAWFGTPTIASDIPVFREVGRSTTIFVDPVSVEQIAEAMDIMTAAPPRRDEASIAHYNWAEIVPRLRTLSLGLDGGTR